MNYANDTVIDNLRDYLKDLVRYWYVLVFSLIITLGGALFYIKFAAQTYNVFTSVLLNTERSNAYGANPDDMMRVNELIEHEKILQNEIYFLHSSPLIRDVIESLDLQVSYYLQEDKIPKEVEFSMKDLYNESPFIVIPDKDHFQPIDVYFYVKVLSEEVCAISSKSGDAMIVDFKDESIINASTSFHLGGQFKFGEEISNTYTSFRILLNSNYNSADYLGKDLFFMFHTNGNLTRVIKNDLSVEASSIEATMVELTLKCNSVEKGIDLLDGLINKYIDKNLEDKTYLANRTIEHLDFQLSDISESLGSSEQELQDIRRSSSVMNIDEKAENLYNQIQTAQTTKDEIERKRSYLTQMEEYFAANRDSSGFLVPSAMGLEDPLLTGLIEELTTLNTEKQQIINNNQLRSPRLRTLDITISNIKEVIVENLQYSLNASYAELSDVDKRLGQLNREFSSLPFTQRRLLGIERKFNLSENVYMSLLEQRIQAQIIKASTLPDLEVVEPPQFASVHAPKKLIVLISALLLGILIPTIFVLSKRLFTNRLQSKDELKKVTNLFHTGSIPQSKGSTINVVNDQPNSITAEAFHSLRSNIMYFLMGKKNQVILVTSSMEGEGKSFSALNIASSLSVTNNKTLLLEFDLRRPSELYSKLGIRGLVGVSSYLINKAELDEITISSDVENLDIILAGQIPPNPIELISSKKAEELFAELKKKYDYIVIDTPPYGVLTDSFVLMKYADIKIYVTRLGYVKKSLLLSCLEDIESKKIENVQLLLNGESPGQESYGKYYTTPNKRLGLKRNRGKNQPGANQKRFKNSG